MYNGIGLMTPRGSGTSGYVQKNLSKMKKMHNRDDFLKELQQMKENVIDARKEANPDILMHEFKRDIEVKKLQLRDELESRGTPEEEIETRVSTLEKRLQEKLTKGEYVLDNAQNTHAQNKSKEQEQKKFDQAFGIANEQFRPGKAFDFDGQEKDRLEKKYLKELAKAEKLVRMKEEKKQEKKRKKEQEKLEATKRKTLTDGILIKAEERKEKRDKKRDGKEKDSEKKEKKQKRE